MKILRDHSIKRLWILVAVAALAGCLGRVKHPPLVVEGGVAVSHEPYQRELFFELENTKQKIFEMMPHPDKDHLRLVTSSGLLDYDIPANKRTGQPFAMPKPYMDIHSALLSRSGEAHYLADGSNEDVLTIYDGQGQIHGRVIKSRLQPFLAADITGDGQAEICVPAYHRKGLVGLGSTLQVFDSQGRKQHARPLAHNISAFRALNVDDDPAQELIFYFYPTTHQKGAFQIEKANGTVLQRWETDPVGDFCIINWNNQPHILSNPDANFRVYNLEGKVVATLAAQHASYFREVRAVRFGGNRYAVLATGDGYRPHYMLCVYNNKGALLYQRFGEGNELCIASLGVDEPSILLAEKTYEQTGKVWQFKLPQ